jgi:hypothetical protein
VAFRAAKKQLVGKKPLVAGKNGLPGNENIHGDFWGGITGLFKFGRCFVFP